jgi:hypothetical protein
MDQMTCITADTLVITAARAFQRLGDIDDDDIVWLATHRWESVDNLRAGDLVCTTGVGPATVLDVNTWKKSK